MDEDVSSKTTKASDNVSAGDGSVDSKVDKNAGTAIPTVVTDAGSGTGLGETASPKIEVGKEEGVADNASAGSKIEESAGAGVSGGVVVGLKADEITPKIEEVLGVSATGGVVSPKPEEVKVAEEGGRRGILPYAAILFLILLLVFQLWYFAFYNSSSVVTTATTTVVLTTRVPTTTTVIILRKEQVAGNISNYLSDAKKDGYFEVRECSRGECKNSRKIEYYTQSLAWLTLGYVGMYEATRNETYLQLINNNMDEIMMRCYQKINNKCQIYGNVSESCNYIVVQVSKAYDATKDVKQLQFLKKLGVCLNRPFYLGDTPMLEAIYARQEFIIYQLCVNESGFSNIDPTWLKCKEFLDFGFEKLHNAENISENSYLIYENNGVEFRQSSCWVQLAKIEAYSATKNKSILDDVERFFDDVQLSKNLPSHKEDSVLSDVLPCLESLLFIKNITNSDKYDGEIKAIDYHIINTYLASYGVAASLGDTPDVVDNVYAVSDNSHLIYLLSKQGNITLNKSI